MWVVHHVMYKNKKMGVFKKIIIFRCTTIGTMTKAHQKDARGQFISVLGYIFSTPIGTHQHAVAFIWCGCSKQTCVNKLPTHYKHQAHDLKLKTNNISSHLTLVFWISVAAEE